jgi:hypothetical protein
MIIVHMTAADQEKSAIADFRPYPNSMHKIIVLGIMLVWGCKSAPFSPTAHSEDLIIIGEGGGIAGIETRYYFTTTGQVYRQEGRDTAFVKLPRIDRRIVTQVIETARQVGLADYAYQTPGNVYKFLTVNVDGKENKIVWSSPKDGVKSTCPTIFNLLKQSIKN